MSNNTNYDKLISISVISILLLRVAGVNIKYVAQIWSFIIINNCYNISDYSDGINTYSFNT